MSPVSRTSLYDPKIKMMGNRFMSSLATQLLFLYGTLSSANLVYDNSSTSHSIFSVNLDIHSWPRTTVLDGKRLFNAKVALSIGEASSNLALVSLLEQANQWLQDGPWTVTSKSAVPPSGSKHDYTSQSMYWWPSTNSSDGCPYIYKDGERNPEVDKWTDLAESRKMIEASYVLSLAWYYTGREAYARHAGLILQTWFLDNSTRMTPHMDQAQIRPCVKENPYSYSGIIDFSQTYSSVLDAVTILQSTDAPGWTSNHQDEFMSWNKQFLSWLIESQNGQNALAASNNHGTFAEMMGAALGIFTGNNTIAHHLLLQARGRIDDNISGNGSQPHELSRTRPWHYSNFNLVAFTRLAALGDKIGMDLWGYSGSDGQSILKAIEFLVPAFLRGESVWPYRDIGFHGYAASDVLHAAADKGSRLAKEALGRSRTEIPPKGDLWVLRPAVEQLDAVTE